MKYLVTGAAGFIGSNIAQVLLDAGHQVTTIDNLSSGFKSNIPKDCLFIRGDISESSCLDQLNHEKFDGIIHLAGQSSAEISFNRPTDDLNCNVMSSLRLLEYAKKTGCKRFIYASSCSVYGNQVNNETFSEQDKVNPCSIYAAGKYASEQYLRIYKENYDIDYTVLRYFHVYGFGQNLSNLKQGIVSIYVQQFIDDAHKEVVVKGPVERIRDLVYIDDVVNVTIDAIDNQDFYNQIVNVGTGNKTSVQDILKAIKDYLNSNKEIIVKKEGTIGDQFLVCADTTLLQSIYPYKFLSFEAGLKKLLDRIKN